MKLEKVNRTFHNFGRKLIDSASSSPSRNDHLGTDEKVLSGFRSYSQGAESKPAFPLFGPPEIYLSSSKEKSKDPVSDPFMDSMVDNFNDTARSNNISSDWLSPPRPYMGYTENRSPTFLSSGNPCLDFFFHVIPDTPAEELTNRLQLAWEQDSLTTLKLLCNLRGVRGTGKMDKEGFYKAAFWLHKNHPKTLAVNATSIAEFGYFKDLPEILSRLIRGLNPVRNFWLGKSSFFNKPKKTLSTEEKRIEEGKKVIDRYNTDPIYRFLHDKISDTFAEQLKLDLENMNSGKFKEISFAAKRCPSLYSSFDRSTLLCESIARRIFPHELYPEYEGLEEAHYAYRIRDRLRKQVLVHLRKILKIPEVYMSTKQWGLIPYSRVPSIAMKTYRKAFMLHDEKRFQEYLDSVKKGKKSIAAGALLPHDIIASLNGWTTDSEIAELQWKRVVDDLSKEGTLRNCLAICDVSGSMLRGIGDNCSPLDVSVALGLLVSELGDEPWKGKLITFSRNPQLQIIKGDGLTKKKMCIEKMEWEMNTDFQKVFDTILEVAKKGKLTEDQMIKRLFVFSDMEFNEVSANEWETDYEAITRKFQESGYSCVPEIVFWKLRNSRATPVPSHQKGVSLVSGFSKNLLKVFLKEGGILDPETTMKEAISGEEYDKLIVVD